jgi:branched-chain amino acid transport system substrate-binding protein
MSRLINRGAKRDREEIGMKVERSGALVRQVWRLASLSLAVVVLLAVAAACGGNEEETTGTGTAAATGSPSTTVVGTAAPQGTTVASGEVPGISDTEILLGAECILSGSMGAVYSTIPKTVSAYFNYINETQGGVCGRKIVYKVEDNTDDPARGVEVARKLVEQDKVFAMVGSLGDAPHPATMEFLNEQQVPDILVSAGGHRFGSDPVGHPWTVQMIPDYTIEGTFFGRYISENLPGKKVAVLWENSAAGIDGLAGVKQGLDPSKNELVADQSYNIGDISIASQVTNLKNSGAEVAIVHGSPGFTAQLIKNADRMGWHPQLFMSYINSDDMMFSFAPPALLEGAITFQALKLAAWRDDPAIARHYELMQKYGGPPPTNFTVYAQALAETAVDILSRSCDNLTRDGLMEAVESTKEFHSDLMLDDVTVSFSDTDHTGMQSGHMLRAAVENNKGKFEYFGPLVEFK